MKFNIPDMTCGHCSAKIENAVMEQDEAAFLEFDMEARSVEIDSDLSSDALMAAIEAAGFEAKPAG